MELSRVTQVRMGIRIEVFTILWMVVEMGVSIAAGLAARSILLTAFGIDSLIELVSGGILLWRLRVESREGDTAGVEAAERKAALAVAVILALLCVYVLVSTVYGLAARLKPDASPAGMAVSGVALVIMPYLAFNKRRIAGRIHSEALAEDAVNSITCAYMAGTVLLGLGLNALFGWWWVENAAALAFLVWLGRETWEAFSEIRRENREGG